MKLQPLYLYRYGEAGDAQALERFNLADCMECGCCSYICPGHLPLVERFRKEKQRLKEGRGT
jgi:electron transport complex protein RnfC